MSAEPMTDSTALARRAPAALIAVVLMVCGTAAEGPASQTASPQALKAAFVSNFAKLSEWPEDALPPGAVFRFCVVGAPATVDALRTAITDHRKGPESVLTELSGSPSKEATDMRTCHVLYVTGLDRRRTEAVLDAVNGAPVFTVSDLDGFARMGGIAELYEENSRIRFAINVQSAQRARLRLGASLLSLAHIVKDGK